MGFHKGHFVPHLCQQRHVILPTSFGIFKFNQFLFHILPRVCDINALIGSLEKTMSFKYAPVHKEKHKNIKVKQGDPAKHLAGQNLVPVTLSEYELVCAEFPIVFAQKQGTENYESVIVTGIDNGENLWIENKQWIADYIPQIAYRFPFGLVPNPEKQDHVVLVIDENSEQYNEAEGNALFNEEGAESEYLVNITQALVEQRKDELHTQNLIAMLKELDVLIPLQMGLTINGMPLNFTGLYHVDRVRMQNLSAEKINQIHEKGYLLPIYVHMASIHRFEKMVRKKENNH